MNANLETIFWNGEEVGVIIDSKIDNFDFYGAWKATKNEDVYGRFLEQVELEGGATVKIGAVDSRLSGTVEIEPNQEINIKLRPRKR